MKRFIFVVIILLSLYAIFCLAKTLFYKHQLSACLNSIGKCNDGGYGLIACPRSEPHYCYAYYKKSYRDILLWK